MFTHAPPQLPALSCCAGFDAHAAPEGRSHSVPSRPPAPGPRLRRGRRLFCPPLGAANTPTEPFSTEPGGFSSSFAAFEKRDGPKSGGPAAPDKPSLAPEEVAHVPLDSEVRVESGCSSTECPRGVRRPLSGTYPRADQWPPLTRLSPASTPCGAAYTLLRDLLAAGEWEKADDETRLKLCQLAGEEAEAREWVYFTEVKTIPSTDLRTMDALWTAYSRGRYGFSVQRQLWVAEKRRWGPFFTRVGWTMGANKAYRKFPSEFLWQADAPKGHLPLTNCLRGTQLLTVPLLTSSAGVESVDAALQEL